MTQLAVCNRLIPPHDYMMHGPFVKLLVDKTSPLLTNGALQMELIELQCDITLHHHYSYNDLTFYTNHLPVTGHRQLTIHAKNMLCLFSSTYFCVTFF